METKPSNVTESWEEDLEQTNHPGFPRTLPVLAQNIPNPRKSLGSGHTVVTGHLTFPSPMKEVE